MRLSSAQSLWSFTAWNSSPASQAEPMMSPSRWAISSVLGMMGTRLKYCRLEAEISWYRCLRPILFLARMMMCLGKRLDLLPWGRSFSIWGLMSWRRRMPSSRSSFSKNGISM